MLLKSLHRYISADNINGEFVVQSNILRHCLKKYFYNQDLIIKIFSFGICII